VVKMAEREEVVKKVLVYEGLLDSSDLFKIIDNWLRERYYDKRERATEEKETRKGKIITYWLDPWKKVTDYFKIIMRFECILGPLKEVEVEREGKKIRLEKGKVRIEIIGFLTYDYENKWIKPLEFFLRYIFDHFIYWPITKKYRDMTREHAEDIYSHLARYFNIKRY
jgi:hypothetical protein